MAIGTTAAILGSAAIGAGASMSAANKGASAQSRAANQSLDLQRDQFDRVSGFFEPYREKGLNALNAYSSELGLGPRPEGFAGFEATPGYQFRMNEGLAAVEASQAGRGALNSGATAKRLMEVGQGMASQEYNNYLNRLQGASQAGQNAAGMLGSAGQAYAANAGNALASLGNAQAAGAIGRANALTGGINNALGAHLYMQGLNQQPNY